MILWKERPYLNLDCEVFKTSSELTDVMLLYCQNFILTSLQLFDKDTKLLIRFICLGLSYCLMKDNVVNVKIFKIIF